MSINETVEKLRLAFKNGKTKPMEFREKQLKNLLRMYEENEEALLAALASDLRKSPIEAKLSEVEYLKNDCKSNIYNFKEWAKPEYPSKPLVFATDTVVIYPEPYGVVLIIGAWNYPIQLSLAPLAGAIAAGNCAVIKPSEVAPSSADLIAKLIPKYLDPECFQVITGGPQETTQLLSNRFDYIFYTGSTTVGKIVYEAATKHLTPVTLELGGKCPVFLDESADLDVASSRIIWGKCMNSGQTCIAPDYILCTKTTQEKFIKIAKDKIKQFYGPDPQSSKDYTRIINDNHFKRITSLLEGQNIALGGKTEPSDKYIEPTIVKDVKPTDKIMQEEIFGPILAIVPVQNAEEAVNFINAREKPLALYAFTNNKEQIDMFLQNTSSGAFVVNDVIMHFSVDTLPFGGVGNSGIGGYHGKYTFDTFSHKKGCLIKDLSKFGEMLQTVRYPPFADKKYSVLKLATAKRPPIPFMKYANQLVIFGLGALAALSLKCACKYFHGSNNQSN